MRGPTAIAAAALVAALLVAGAPAPATALAAPGPCAIERQDGQSMAAWVKSEIRCAALKWSVPGGAAKAICIGKAESGLDPKSRSAPGRYLGVFQHERDAWPDRYATWARKAWGLDSSALNGRTNTIVTIRMVHSDGWGPWRNVDGC